MEHLEEFHRPQFISEYPTYAADLFHMLDERNFTEESVFQYFVKREKGKLHKEVIISLVHSLRTLNIEIDHVLNIYIF